MTTTKIIRILRILQRLFYKHRVFMHTEKYCDFGQGYCNATYPLWYRIGITSDKLYLIGGDPAWGASCVPYITPAIIDSEFAHRAEIAKGGYGGSHDHGPVSGSFLRTFKNILSKYNIRFCVMHKDVLSGKREYYGCKYEGDPRDWQSQMLIGDNVVVTATGVLCGETFGDMISILTGKPVGLQRCAAVYRVKALRDLLNDLDFRFELRDDLLAVFTKPETHEYGFFSCASLEAGVDASILSDLIERIEE